MMVDLQKKSLKQTHLPTLQSSKKVGLLLPSLVLQIVLFCFCFFKKRSTDLAFKISFEKCHLLFFLIFIGRYICFLLLNYWPLSFNSHGNN